MPVNASASPFSTFFLFATALAVGLPALLPLVPVGQIGRRFFLLITLIAIVFVALAVGAAGIRLPWCYLLFGGLLIVYNLSLPRQSGVDWSERRERLEGGASKWQRSLAFGSLLAATAVGLLGLCLDARAYATTLGALQSVELLVGLSFLSSSLLLGGVVLAMVLGHWYLVARKLSFAPLRRVTAVLLFVLAARLVLVGASVSAQASLWSEMLNQGGWTDFFLRSGLFIGARFLFGLLLPLALMILVWRCVKIESNQSATGILYVVVAFVLIGEIIAKHLLVSQRLLL